MRGNLYHKLDGTIVLHIEFTREDMTTVPLDRFDLAQLREKPRTISDWLLDAELLARRIEQRYAAKASAEER